MPKRARGRLRLPVLTFHPSCAPGWRPAGEVALHACSTTRPKAARAIVAVQLTTRIMLVMPASSIVYKKTRMPNAEPRCELPFTVTPASGALAASLSATCLSVHSAELPSWAECTGVCVGSIGSASKGSAVGSPPPQLNTH